MYVLFISREEKKIHVHAEIETGIKENSQHQVFTEWSYFFHQFFIPLYPLKG